MMFFDLLLRGSIVIGLFSAFIIIFLGVSGLRDKIVITAPKIISKLFSCNFCLSFWVSLLVAILLSLYTGYACYLIVPFIVSPIIRYL